MSTLYSSNVINNPKRTKGAINKQIMLCRIPLISTGWCGLKNAKVATIKIVKIKKLSRPLVLSLQCCYACCFLLSLALRLMMQSSIIRISDLFGSLLFIQSNLYRENFTSESKFVLPDSAFK